MAVAAKELPMPVVRIDAADWYKREDFLAALNSGAVATWHELGKEPSEMSDMFVTFDHGEGSNMCGAPEHGCIPDDIWEEICSMMHQIGVDEALLWITNLEEIDGR